MTEAQKAEMQIESLRENWMDLQQEWDQLEDSDRYEIHQYFNRLNAGLGDLLFQNSSHSIHGKLYDMPLPERQITLQKLQDCKLVQFVGSSELSTIAGSWLP